MATFLPACLPAVHSPLKMAALGPVASSCGHGNVPSAIVLALRRDVVYLARCTSMHYGTA